MISFFVPGEPVAKGRPRLSVRGRFAHAYTPEKTRNFEAYVRYCAQEHAPDVPLDCPLNCRVQFIFSRPKSLPKKVFHHTKKPDLDNLVKILDALNGIIWVDDSRIVSLEVNKIYGAKPGFAIEIEEVHGL